ncbi:MAG: peptidoglycan-binding protein [Clostridia bacterium BRH_c25]|nr:MAG: peptidoglycan-binding protein [Clostridia bacterium BRH_c25]
MQKRKIIFAVFFVAVLSVVLFIGSNPVSAASILLKSGMKGEAVTRLQQDLKKLGYFSASPTGYYGDITIKAVKNLQKSHGIARDGVAGNDTLSLINRLLDGSSGTASGGTSISISGKVLKKGTSGKEIVNLQSDLKKLSLFTLQSTGYYGDATEKAVKNLQKKNGLLQDGVAGNATISLINRLLGGASSTSSRGTARQTNYLLPWFNEVSKIFKIGTTATVYDIETGLSFKVKRTYGTNHADCEPLTANDTKIMKKIYNGSWSWGRRAIIATVGSTKIAASMNGMPHAGRDNKPANKYITSRSGGYGAGTNLDAVKGNGMDGQFCIHFSGSKTHGTNRVDSGHQAMVKKAAEWANEKLIAIY